MDELMKNVLYISYDGMTDPLGQSQVLPYLVNLSASGYNFTILSCEKKKKYKKNKEIISKICNENGMAWEPLFFHTRPPIISKYFDLYSLKRKAIVLQNKRKFDLIHCRSYQAIEIGLYLKKKYGVKVLFDMRGFWVDERVDGGIWNFKNPLYRIAYRYYKKKEARYIAWADYIISLTEAGKKEITTWNAYNNIPIEVIPCCADFELFSMKLPGEKELARKELGISADEMAVSYIGSVKGWYLMDEMMDFFYVLKQKYTKAKFLILTQDSPDLVYSIAQKKNISKQDLIVRFALRKQVPEYAKAGDISIFFIKQAYSKIASSPTKLGELLAMGIPVICNDKVGDVKEIVEKANAGIVISTFEKISYQKAVDQVERLCQLNPATIRDSIRSYYELKTGITKYLAVYKTLLGN